VSSGGADLSHPGDFTTTPTHDVNIVLPLLVAVTIAHAFTVLVRDRSILTEKVARRGFHIEPRVRRRSAGDPVRPGGDA
jgi:hypothetical protein